MSLPTTWACSTCTFDNNDIALTCEMCNTQVSTWVCLKCTFETRVVDGTTSGKCHACHTLFEVVAASGDAVAAHVAPVVAVAAPVEVVEAVAAPVDPETLTKDKNWTCPRCKFLNLSVEHTISYDCHVCRYHDSVALAYDKNFADNEAAEVEAALAAVKAFKRK